MVDERWRRRRKATERVLQLVEAVSTPLRFDAFDALLKVRVKNPESAVRPGSQSSARLVRFGTLLLLPPGLYSVVVADHASWLTLSHTGKRSLLTACWTDGWAAWDLGSPCDLLPPAPIYFRSDRDCGSHFFLFASSQTLSLSQSRRSHLHLHAQHTVTWHPT